MLPSARMNGRRCRAVVLLAAGWILPAAFSAVLLAHELGHAHEPAAPQAAEALLHGHVHSDGDPGHRHPFAGSPDLSRGTARTILVGPPAATDSLEVRPPARSWPPAAHRADPGPGGPSRQASLSIFRI